MCFGFVSDLLFRGRLHVVAFPEAAGQLAGSGHEEQDIDDQQGTDGGKEVGKDLLIACVKGEYNAGTRTRHENERINEEVTRHDVITGN